jgi:hypothetical protein
LPAAETEGSDGGSLKEVEVLQKSLISIQFPALTSKTQPARVIFLLPFSKFFGISGGNFRCFVMMLLHCTTLLLPNEVFTARKFFKILKPNICLFTFDDFENYVTQEVNVEFEF